MRSRKTIPGERFTCSRCEFSDVAFPPAGGGSNYLVHHVREGLSVKLCPGCAEKGDRERIAAGARTAFGYLACGKLKGSQPFGIDRDPGTSFDGVHGRSMGRVVHVGAEVPRTRCGPYGVRHYLRVRMFDGSTWHGTGAPGMWCSLRRCAR